MKLAQLRLVEETSIITRQLFCHPGNVRTHSLTISDGNFRLLIFATTMSLRHDNLVHYYEGEG